MPAWYHTVCGHVEAGKISLNKLPPSQMTHRNPALLYFVPRWKSRRVNWSPLELLQCDLRSLFFLAEIYQWSEDAVICPFSHFSSVFVLFWLWANCILSQLAFCSHCLAAPVSMEVPAWTGSTPLPASVRWGLQDSSASRKSMSAIHILAGTKALAWTAWAHTDVYVLWVIQGRTVRWVMFPCLFCTGFDLSSSRSDPVRCEVPADMAESCSFSSLRGGSPLSPGKSMSSASVWQSRCPRAKLWKSEVSVGKEEKNAWWLMRTGVAGTF